VDKVGLLTPSSENATGFDRVEGPYPDWRMPNKVRWMVSPNASVEFVGEDEGRDLYLLKMRVLAMATPQSLSVSLNEKPLLTRRLEFPNQWLQLISEPVRLNQGQNTLKLKAERLVPSPDPAGGDLYVLFDELVFQKE